MRFFITPTGHTATGHIRNEPYFHQATDHSYHIPALLLFYLPNTVYLLVRDRLPLANVGKKTDNAK